MRFNTSIIESVRSLKFVDRNKNVNRDPEENRQTYDVKKLAEQERNQPRDNSSLQSRNGITYLTLELCLAEILGTFMLMFFGCMSLISGFSQSPVPSMQPALMFGFVVSTIITIFGHISSAHLNPAVTVASLVLGDISVLHAVVYVIAQCIGCVLGYATLGVVTPHDILTFGISPDRGLCTTIPHPSLSDSQAFLIEFLCTSLLVFTCCGVWDHRNSHQGDSNPIKFALAVAVCSVTVGPYTGASMNPARSLAPAFVNRIWTKQWIYWTAPLLAGALTPLLYMFAFERKRLERQSIKTLPNEINANVPKY